MTTPEHIEQELARIQRGEARTWGQVAELLDKIDTSGLWHRDSRSFTEWLNKHSQIFGVKPAMLWRYLISGRYLQGLRFKLPFRNTRFPSPNVLNHLPDSVSPEGIELVAKLERVIPRDDFRKLLKRALEGDIRRAELRGLWEAYGPVLEGKTARGRGVVAPKINRNDVKQYQAYREAKLLSMLRAEGSAWTGVDMPERYEVFLRVTPEGPPAGRSKSMFPAVAVVKPKRRAIEYHGLLFAPGSGKLKGFGEHQRAFADYLWVISEVWFHSDKPRAPSPDIPRGIGRIYMDSATLRVAVAAERMPKSGSRRADLASALLLRALKR